MTSPHFVVDNVDRSPLTTRFVPSPTGLPHRGHGASAVLAWQMARTSAGRFILRIENIDTARCRPEHEAGIRADLAWLRLDWDGPLCRQRERYTALRSTRWWPWALSIRVSARGPTSPRPLARPTPQYHHHPLVLGGDGKRLAKRDGCETLAMLRVAGAAPSALLDSLQNNSPVDD